MSKQSIEYKNDSKVKESEELSIEEFKYREDKDSRDTLIICFFIFLMCLTICLTVVFA